MKKEFIQQLVMIERDRAEKLHPNWPEDIIHAAAILMEEAGSLIKACINFIYFNDDTRKIRDEAVSVAAMAERFLLNYPDHYKTSIKRFKYGKKRS